MLAGATSSLSAKWTTDIATPSAFGLAREPYPDQKRHTFASVDLAYTTAFPIMSTAIFSGLAKGESRKSAGIAALERPIVHPSNEQ